MSIGNKNHQCLPLGGKVARPQAVTDEGAMTENVNKWSAVTIIIVGRDDLGAPDTGTNGANGG